MVEKEILLTGDPNKEVLARELLEGLLVGFVVKFRMSLGI